MYEFSATISHPFAESRPENRDTRIRIQEKLDALMTSVESLMKLCDETFQSCEILYFTY